MHTDAQLIHYLFYWKWSFLNICYDLASNCSFFTFGLESRLESRFDVKMEQNSRKWEPKMNLIDFGAFRRKMQMPSHNKEEFSRVLNFSIPEKDFILMAFSMKFVNGYVSSHMGMHQSVILWGILEEASARILLIDTLGLSEFVYCIEKVSFKNRMILDFQKERLSLKPKFWAQCRRRRTNHICEPIRKRHDDSQYESKTF